MILSAVFSACFFAASALILSVAALYPNSCISLSIILACATDRSFPTIFSAPSACMLIRFCFMVCIAVLFVAWSISAFAIALFHSATAFCALASDSTRFDPVIPSVMVLMLVS